jgi:thiol:disulfide interchange protein DsbC
MIRTSLLGLAVTLGMLSLPVLAQGQNSAQTTILQSLKAANPNVEYGQPRVSPITGVYSVQVKGGPVLYVAADGKHMIVGDVMTIGANGFARYEDPQLIEDRKKAIASINVKDTIAFKPKGETKKVVYVFTDVDCGYCRKLHSQMNEYVEDGQKFKGYNDLGIEVRYLAYPRAGIGSASAQKLISAWCADNPQDALTKLKNNQAVENKTCENPVAAQFGLGGQLGVSGTPSIFTLDGQVLPGYVPPADLAQTLGL